MKTFHIATAAAAVTLSSLPSTIVAQQQDEVDPSFSSVEPITCSCTPNSYTFQLNFDGTCVASTIGASDGVDGSICFYTEGGTPEELDAQNVLSPPSRGRRRLLGSNVLSKALDLFSRGNTNNEKHQGEDEWMERALSGVDFTRQLQHAQLFAVNNNNNDNVEFGRNLQAAPLDTVVTTITSVTFLETDTTPALNIINQDSTYFEISGTDGQLLEYESVSARLDPTVPLSDQVNDVPGGVILVLFGVNAANEVIQNRVAWGYARNYCDEVPLSPGAEVGWVTIHHIDPPYSAFCDGVTDAPTVTPDEPVITTSQTTTTEATVVEDTTTKPDDGYWGGSESKATKSPTTEVVKSKSKSSKALFSKGTKSSTVDAKAQKEATDSDSASSKAAKKEALFKHESKTGKGSSSDDSSTSKTSKVADAKAGKHSTGVDDSSSTKGSDNAPSTKAEKLGDAKAEKVPSGNKDSTKSPTELPKPAKGSGMSMPPKVKDPSKTGSVKVSKTGKASTSSSDTATTPSDAKADKQSSTSDTSMHGSKATKVFKSSKGSKAAGDESSKAKAAKATASKGESSSSNSTSDAKAGKESTGDKSSKGSSGKPSKGMSMPKHHGPGSAPSSKTDKGHTETKPEPVDAKAKKEGSSKTEKTSSSDSSITTPLLKHTKSSKAMSVPAKSSSSKTSKTTTGKASKAAADAKAEKATHPDGWIASAKADKINTTNGYRVIVKKPVRH